MAIPRLAPWRGPAILSYGFRPFFLLGALYAALAMLAWLPVFFGEITLLSLFPPVDWHSHEMIFGFVAAIVTGFLLTSIPNWTGRLPVQGLPLLALVLLWFTGRLAVTFSLWLGPLATAVFDSLFLFAVIAAATIEIAAGRNWRNLKVLAPVVVLLAANLLFHVELWLEGATDMSRRLAIAAIITLIMLIGGRIIPSFTRNWLARNNPGRLPAPFGRADMLVLAASVVTLGMWTLAPEHEATSVLALLAGAGNVLRLARWAGWRACSDPLVLVLHVSYGFIPAGFLLMAGAIHDPGVAMAAATHAFAVGAIGSMTLSVMVRASRGHTGRPVVAGAGELIVFGAIGLAAIARVVACFDVPAQPLWLHASALAWVTAFLGFVLTNGPALCRGRQFPDVPG